MADSVFIETGGDSAQFRESSQRSAQRLTKRIVFWVAAHYAGNHLTSR